MARRDVAALTEQMVRAAGDRALRERIGRHAHARVRVHTLADAVAQYRDALHGAVRRHRA
jgi:hypothetical protein